MIVSRMAKRFTLLMAMAIVVVGTLTATIASAAPVVLTNGSFETGSLSPWTAGGNGVDLVDGWDAKDGTKLVDLNALNSGSISQTLSTVPGGVYTVGFWVSGNPQCGTGLTKSLTAGASGSSISLSYTVPSTATTSNLDWVEHTFNFTASGSSTALTFTSGTGTACGALIDLVVVSLVSAPPSLSVSGNVTYTEDGPAVVVAPGLTIGGTESIDGAKVTIGGGFNATQDSLGVSGALPAGISSSYNSATGVLTLAGTAGPADYQQALGQVAYSNSSQNPTTAPRTVTFNIGNQLAFVDNGHFYEFIPSGVPNGVSWTSAHAAAATKTLYGMQGYVATITSAAENTFIKEKLQGNGWLGASDAAAEGTWKWVAGPENGTLLSAGYTAWNTGEPNNAGNEDYLHMIGNPSAGPLGTWNDLPNGGGGGAYAVLGYVVEYGGSASDPSGLQLTGDATVNVQPVNDPPTANAGGPYAVDEGSSTTLNGSGSDIDSPSVTFAWDLDNIAGFETPGQNATFTGLDGPATPTVRLQVCDTGTPLPSACTVAPVTVTVNNVAPSVAVAGTNSAYYVDWTAANPGGGTASGVITLPNGHTINVTFDALNPDLSHAPYYGAQTSGGTNFWIPSGPYISTEVPNAPPDSDILQLSGTNGVTYKVTLSEPIDDPIMAILSLGSTSNPGVYDFDSPFTIVSQGSGYWGGGPTSLVQQPGDALKGNEGHGTIKFLGTYTTFSWTVPDNEVWHGFTFAIRSTTALAETVFVDEGQTATNHGTWSDPGLNGDGVVVSASIGTVNTHGDGTWDWSFATSDGPPQSQTVTVTATDKDNASTSETFELTVNNVAPTIMATFQVAPIPEGSVSTSGNLLATATDPAGSNDPLTFAFDCDNNGSYETPAHPNTSAADCFFDDNGSYTVGILVTDGDGGSDTGSVIAVVTNVAPTAFLPNAGPVDENSPATLTFQAQFDPSSADSATLRYSIACDGNPASLATSYTTASSSPSQACTYPDNGSYPVVGRIFDKDGGSNDYSATAQVNNAAPTLTIDTASQVVLAGGSVFLGVNGTQQTHGASATDPGSDDLTFTWDFQVSGVSNTYFNNDASPEPPTPSPAGTAPFAASDSASVTFTAPGIYTITVTVTDDDGGSDSATFTKIVVDECKCTKSQGFWRHQFSGKGKPQIDGATLQTYLDVASFASAYFSGLTLADAAAVFTPGGQGDDENDNSNMRGKAVAQALAAWLNFAKGAVSLDDVITVGADEDGEGGQGFSGTFVEGMALVEVILLNPASTHADYVLAKSIAEAINELSEHDPACDGDEDEGDGNHDVGSHNADDQGKGDNGGNGKDRGEQSGDDTGGQGKGGNGGGKKGNGRG